MTPLPRVPNRQPRFNFLVVNNPHSGQGAWVTTRLRRKWHRKQLHSFMDRHPQNGTWVEESRIDEFRQALGDALLQRENWHVLAVRGGDGTFREVLETAIGVLGEDSLPPLLPLSGGTNEVIHYDVRTLGNPTRVLGRVVNRLERGQPLSYRRRGLLRLAIEGQEKPLYGMLFSSGYLFDMVQEYERHPRKRHLAWMVGESIFRGSSFRPQSMRPLPTWARDDWNIKLQWNGHGRAREDFSVAFVSSLKKIRAPVVAPLSLYHDPQGDPRHFTLIASNRSFMELTRPSFFKTRRLQPQPTDPDDPSYGFIKTTTNKIKMRTDRGFSLEGELIELQGRPWITLQVGPVLEIPNVRS